MPVIVRTGALAGIRGLPVSAEVVISRGLPGYHLVGLPGTEVRESRERVLSALRHSGVRVPPGRIAVNLAPAGVRKSGASFDLAIAIGIVAAAEGWIPTGPMPQRLGALFLGELSLFGELRPVRGLLPVLLDVAAAGGPLKPTTTAPPSDPAMVAVVPAVQRDEALLVPGLRVIAARDLAEVLAWCRDGHQARAGFEATGAGGRSAAERTAARLALANDAAATLAACQVLGRLCGQALARKAAVVAATGRHNLLLVGPPGAGKTRLARLLADLQPPLGDDEALAVTRIQSAAGLQAGSGLTRRRPFRAPHHTITTAGLVGGGAGLRPGEVTLAHGGLLFLDELAEFGSAVLDALRQPLQDGEITVSRGSGQRRLPARFQLVAACNPCRCGYLGSTTHTCRCPPRERSRYLGRLSGPLLDRFELMVEMADWRGAFDARETGDAPASASEPVSWRDFPSPATLVAARGRLLDWERRGGPPEAPGNAAWLDRARLALGLSLRAVVRCRAVATTVAALDGAARVDPSHLGEALEFRRQTILAGGD